MALFIQILTHILPFHLSGHHFFQSSFVYLLRGEEKCYGIWVLAFFRITIALEVIGIAIFS